MGIDELDGRLIVLLAREPRIGVLEASRRLGVARGTVQARLDRLQSNGVIRGFGPQVDPAALGYPVTAFATLEIKQGQGADVRAHLDGVPEVLELHTTTGHGDMLCRLVARSNADLQRVIDRVVGFEGIVRASTAIVMENPVPHRIIRWWSRRRRTTTPPAPDDSRRHKDFFANKSLQRNLCIPRVEPCPKATPRTSPRALRPPDRSPHRWSRASACSTPARCAVSPTPCGCGCWPSCAARARPPLPNSPNASGSPADPPATTCASSPRTASSRTRPATARGGNGGGRRCTRHRLRRVADPRRDPDTSSAAGIFLQTVAANHAQEVAVWIAEAQTRLTRWQPGADLSDFTLRLTPGQSAELVGRLHEVINGYRDLPESPETQTVRLHTHVLPRSAPAG